MKNLINFFRAMGEETRAKIIMMLLRGEMCICELIDKLGLSQSAVSRHVKILKQTDLVNVRRCGNSRIGAAGLALGVCETIVFLAKCIKIHRTE